MQIFGREPVRWVGIIVALIAAIVSTLLGQGVISDTLAGKITDITKAGEGLLVLLLPIITAEFARPHTTPLAAPQLPVGTPVLNPAVPGGDTPPPDLVVARADSVAATDNDPDVVIPDEADEPTSDPIVE